MGFELDFILRLLGEITLPVGPATASPRNRGPADDENDRRRAVAHCGRSVSLRVLKTVDRKTLVQALRAHYAYLTGRPSARRLSLAHCDLTGVQLPGADLREADLTGCRLKGANLSGAVLDRACLYGADLRDADLRQARLERADLRGACLRGANLTKANLAGCDFREGQIALHDAEQGLRLLSHKVQPGDLDFAVLTGANLSGSQMTGTSASRADFANAILRGVVLGGARLRDARFDGADLTDADLSGADLQGATFVGAMLVACNMTYAETRGAKLDAAIRSPEDIVYLDEAPLADRLSDHERYWATGGTTGAPALLPHVDFRRGLNLRARRLSGLRAPDSIFFGLDLEGAQLQGADLSRCDFRGANLRGVDFRGARLQGALFDRARMGEARLDPLITPDGREIRTDLSGAHLLYADLRGANARRARFLYADMTGARLEGCDLAEAEFAGETARAAD